MTTVVQGRSADGFKRWVRSGGEAPSTGPLLSNGKLGIVPTFSSAVGLDTSTSVLGRGGEAYGTLDDAFHPCRFRFLSSASQPGQQQQHQLLTSDDPTLAPTYVLDMRNAALTVPVRVMATAAGETTALCDVTHTVRVLRHLPHCVLHTLAVTVPPEAQDGFQIVHELRGGAGTVSPVFDSTLIASPHESTATYMMTGRATAAKDGRAVHAACVYLFEEPGLVECAGFNASTCGTTGFTRLRLSAPAAAEGSAVGDASHTYVVHVLTGMMADGDADAPQDQLRRVLLGCSFRPHLELVARHEAAWADLWLSDMRLASKEGMTDAVLDARFASWAAALRWAAFNVHSCARPGSVVDLNGTMAGGNGELWIVPLLLLIHTEAGRAAVDARHSALGKAARAAAAHGLKGVKFPFRNGGGNALAESWDGRGPLRLFDTALVAVNAWNCYRITRDRDWLLEKGYPLLRDVADAVASACDPDRVQEGVYRMRATVGLDDSAAPPAVDNALTVCCARLALRAATEAAYDLGYRPKPLWLAVRWGLSVPFLPAPDAANVVAVDASSSPGPPAPEVVGVEPLLLLTSGLSELEFGPDGARPAAAALRATLDFWRPRLTRAAMARPATKLVLAHVLAHKAQVDVAAVADLDAVMDEFLAAHAGGDWGNLGEREANVHNDLNLSAMLLLAVLRGLGGVAVGGGVSETQFLYAEMGVTAATTSSVLPLTWERLLIGGLGGDPRADYNVYNRLLFPTAPLSRSDVVPWTVDAFS